MSQILERKIYVMTFGLYFEVPAKKIEISKKKYRKTGLLWPLFEVFVFYYFICFDNQLIQSQYPKYLFRPSFWLNDEIIGIR